MAHRKIVPMRRKSLQHALEYAITAGFYGVMRLLPIGAASAFGGSIARALGPHIGRSNLARAQMRAHLPGIGEADITRFTADMWENLGRTFAEYPHMHRAAMSRRILIEGGDMLKQLKAQGKPLLLISGHIGNWEILPKATHMLGFPVHVIYRPPNNPYTHRMIDTIRNRYSLGHYGKGLEGARGVMDAFKKNESVIMLIDQKDNKGTPLDFLGAPAMTMTSATKLALKYGAIAVPCFVERLGGAQFRVIFEAPMEPPVDTGDAEARASAFTQAMNNRLSQWISAHPGQWFWLHRRWPKEAT